LLFAGFGAQIACIDTGLDLFRSHRQKTHKI